MPKEFWFTPSDYSPSYYVRVDGENIELLKMQDIWPGYPGAKDIPLEPHYIDYIERNARAQVLAKAELY
jgi:hypothetical protein